jgi:hypothetical protein
LNNGIHLQDVLGEHSHDEYERKEKKRQHAMIAQAKQLAYRVNGQKITGEQGREYGRDPNRKECRIQTLQYIRGQ